MKFRTNLKCPHCKELLLEAEKMKGCLIDTMFTTEKRREFVANHKYRLYKCPNQCAGKYMRWDKIGIPYLRTVSFWYTKIFIILGLSGVTNRKRFEYALVEDRV